MLTSRQGARACSRLHIHTAIGQVDRGHAHRLYPYAPHASVGACIMHFASATRRARAHTFSLSPTSQASQSRRSCFFPSFFFPPSESAVSVCVCSACACLCVLQGLTRARSWNYFPPEVIAANAMLISISAGVLRKVKPRERFFTL